VNPEFCLNISVFVLVRQGSSVLLLHRKNTGWQDNKWSLPAGRHDGGQTLPEAAARELLEETSLVVQSDNLELVHLQHHKIGRDGKEWLGVYFQASHWTGTPRLLEPDKHSLLEWHELNALPETMVNYVRLAIESSVVGQRFSSFGW
jgi:8-oxo-dGTP diphosphatase